MRAAYVCCVWGLLITAIGGGCATFSQPKQQDVELPPATAEQQAWWEANREKARYMPGRGWYVQGTSGYFDDSGRPLKGGFTGSSNSVDAPLDESADTSAFSPNAFNTKLKILVGQGPNENVAKQAFADAETLFRQQKYKEAAKKYKVAYLRWPDSPQEEDAIFKTAESYFFADSYSLANDNYSLLVKKYPSTQYLDRVVARRFAVARYWEQDHAQHPHFALTPNVTDKTRPHFDTHGHALKIYDRIRLDDPTGPLADDSIMATANAYFVLARYEDADYYFTLLRNEYPKSEHQFTAHLLGLRAKLLKYQGPDYEGAVLDEAEELAKQLVTQFPKELGEEKERIELARAEIRAQKALREYKVAMYYRKGKYNAAARLYFEEVAKNFPDTKLAADARSKIVEAQGQPDSPDPPFHWLVSWLPESKTGQLGAGAGMSAIPQGMPSTPQGMGTMGGMGGMGPGN